MTAEQPSRLVLQCPHCGFKSVEKRSLQRGPALVHCAACRREIRVRGVCCVFCDYGRPGCGAASSFQ